MIRIVLDTNVFVSGLFWSGPPSQILDAWEEKNLTLVFSLDIMEEYKRIAHALAHKRELHQDMNVSAALELIAIHGELASPISLDKSISRDPDDDKFIACALGADCFLIVSGDKDLLDISGYAGINIVKPGEFLKHYLSKE
ncbi:MAG: putative toxin-antitoxin system toxin component, PIN family [Legionellales bacterium]|jgi:putative PIN family toxin of toxin-antitoxin system